MQNGERVISTVDERPPADGAKDGSRVPRPRDLVGAVAAAALVAVAVIVARRGNEVVTPLLTENANTFRDFAEGAPLFAWWNPHIGWGTPFAVAIAVAVVTFGPRIADRLPWRPLLLLTWLTSLAWVFSLAMIDGWTEGFAGKLSAKDEYLYEVDGVTDIPAMLRGFAGRIVDGQADSWTTHVSGHPPGALLTFVWLDRVGLGGGAWAATLCVVVGASAATAVTVALGALAGRDLARRAAPFLVLAPVAIWIGVSADGYFAGVVAWGLALLALSATHSVRHPAVAAAAAGVLLGWAIFLNYGLVLIGFVAVAILVIARTARPLLPAVVGALAVAAAFYAAGFWWFDGYELVQERYWQGIARKRPFEYWGWANFASLVCAVGLAVPAALGRVFAWKRVRALEPVVLVVGSALLAVTFADLSSLSKAETERIWLPFQMWMLAATALLPRRAAWFWLATQATLALAINHLLTTNW